MRKRILTNFIVILLASALTSGLLAFNFIKSNYIKNKEEKLLTNINLIEDALNQKYESFEKVNFYRLAQELSFLTNSRVTFINTEGRAIADSINNSIIFEWFNREPEFQHAMRGERQIVQRYSREVGKKFFYLAMPPVKVGNLEVVVRLGDDYKEIDHTIEKFFMYVLISTIIGLIFAIIIGYISVGRITKPVKELTEASKLIAEGDFNKKVEVNTKDEIEELSISFNQMASKLKWTIDQIKDKNTKMNAILASMQEGLLALDYKNRVILANHSAKEILDINNIQIGAHIKELLDTDMAEKIEKIIADKKEHNIEIEIGDENKKTIHLSTSIIQGKDDHEDRIGILLIIRDITSIRKLEKMRKDFVANVSHELRTPLTSIGGFVETLKIKELDEKNRNKAIDIIEFEVERLKGLINNLLRLSEIENIENVKHLADIDIKDDIYEVIKLLGPLADKKNIKLMLNMGDSLNPINGDRDWFRLILTNLIENSIKYTDEDGNVKIYISNYGQGINLIIEDNGIGIPEEDIPRIFERFYRVDKSRSNIIEGSGLGLSIVKHIVILFGGSIEVESELGKGSRFTVILP
ncbi:MAG: HAMP domain-containing protein [Tissierellia bacterium]|nr:HAMP domain-containing protein [Tissierellia bacterium]